MKKQLNSIISAIIAFLFIFTFASPAKAVTTGPAWPHNGTGWPYVVVQDDTVGAFPVAEAVKRWGRILHVSTCAAHPNAACVHVRSMDDGDNGYSGQTPRSMDDTRIYWAECNLNSWYATHTYAGNYNYRLQVAMHELGHALGLEHDTGSGVMTPGVNGTRTVVSPFEYRELNDLYDMP